MFRIELDPRSDQSPELEHACESTCREEEEGELRRGSHGRGDRGSGLSPMWTMGGLCEDTLPGRHCVLNKREVTVSILLQETEVWAF